MINSNEFYNILAGCEFNSIEYSEKAANYIKENIKSAEFIGKFDAAERYTFTELTFKDNSKLKFSNITLKVYNLKWIKNNDNEIFLKIKYQDKVMKIKDLKSIEKSEIDNLKKQKKKNLKKYQIENSYDFIL